MDKYKASTHRCLRPNKKDCEWRDTILKDAYCIIQSKERPCIEEEVIMEAKEEQKKIGIEDSEWISKMVKELTEFLDRAPTMDIMDRVNDACGHLRKAKIFINKFYGIIKVNE